MLNPDQCAVVWVGGGEGGREPEGGSHEDGHEDSHADGHEGWKGGGGEWREVGVWFNAGANPPGQYAPLLLRESSLLTIYWSESTLSS